jgi:hypothetical protein
MEISAQIRWGLTGTPLQHDVKELLSLIKLIGVVNPPVLLTDLSKYIYRRTLDTTPELLLKMPKLNLNIVKVYLPLTVATFFFPFLPTS